MNQALDAFRKAKFNWTRPLESVWRDANATVGGPTETLIDSIVADLHEDAQIDADNPAGAVIVGEAGVGKTHLVGELRRKTWESGAWFVLLDVIGITDFWKSAALSFLTSLLQEMPGGRRQYEAVLSGVARRLGVERQVDAAFAIPTVNAKRIVDLLIPNLRMMDPNRALQHEDVFRALALLRSPDPAAVGIAHAWLQGYDADEDARKAQGLTKPPPQAVDLVRGMSWVMSLAGPTLIAVDQIDGVVNSGSVTIQQDSFGEMKSFADVLAAGLLQLYDKVSRSRTVITCLYDSWKEMAGGLDSATHRFVLRPYVLTGLTEEAAISALVSNRLMPAYAAVGFVPEYSTWPFTPAAISGARGMMPRSILIQCDAFRRRCLADGRVPLCNVIALNGPDPEPLPEPPSSSYDSDLGRARIDAKTDGLLDPKDDGAIGRLLRDVFDLYARQIVPRKAIDVESQGDQAQKMPPLHGRLTFTFRDENDREEHFCFRAIEHDNAIAFQARLRAALTAAGISNRIPGRHLLVVRRGAIPGGSKTKQLYDAFIAADGVVIDPVDEDLRTFITLRAMRDAAVAGNNLAGFEAWLQKSDPLCETAFFKAAGLCPPPGIPPLPIATKATLITAEHEAEITKPKAGDPPEVLQNAPAVAAAPTAIPIGHRLTADAEPLMLPTAVLPRHVAIIAGAGSGKTVLLRRIVEEAALAGIPAIVIDPNNDLSRLGDAWPEDPAAFTTEDSAKAKRYNDSVEVVIWTPGIHAGNPLFLSVLPDFAAVGDDRDERDQAVMMAADTLGPIAGAKTDIQKGVLTATVRYFANKGGGSLTDMTALLSELPEGVSAIRKADEIAAKMADGLLAAVETNPLLKASGAVLDPKLLFYGSDPKRTRISVINLSGLASDAAKQDFVNRLQMTLFGWIKKNPSPTGRLYVIDEAQNFVPSGQSALSKTSGVQLVAQARKYGLGMIVVTQAPKGIDNKVVSNCTTQFLGKQNSPTDQQTVKEMIAGTGGRADDIGKLKQGEFYFKTEGSGKPVKIATPICLSHHPSNPPTPEEIVARAKRSVP
ncbi:ATP-binding protein [Beijerinckia sp. L45]|uniref:ATP-binding protein n=1 Tax=Beijerinckia sp. L45 TaxID=1641855 RepID=UPI00131C1FCA|nr:ATP-binding protein [Beijerinckia sp. L45]